MEDRVKQLKFVFNVIMVLCITLFFTAGNCLASETEVSAYGYVKLDTIYETGNSFPGNYAFYAVNPGDSDGLLHMTANQTRLGLTIKAPGCGDFKLSGNVEIDFYGGNAENKAYNFMRKAYLEISNGKISILAGQTSDIISPLFPSDLNYSVLWGMGNIGYRRPQLRLTKYFKGEKSEFKLEVGVVRAIGNGLFGGIALGTPNAQGRLSGKFLMANAAVELGVSGHYGKSKESAAKDFTTQSINVDFQLSMGKNVKFLAEYFNGKNLGTYLGGILQSSNTDTGTEIAAQGFFANLVIQLSPKISSSLAFGTDDPKDGDLSAGYRSKNTAIFGNIIFKLAPALSMGFQATHCQTDYLNLENQKTLRLQNSWMLSF
jgi:hypothetical protein